MRHVQKRRSILLRAVLLVLLFLTSPWTGVADTVTQPLATFGFGSVDTVALSTDGRQVATSGPGGVFLWDAASGSNTFRLQDHHARVSVLAFSPDSTVLASAGRDNQVRLWDPRSGAPLGSFGPLPIETLGLDVSPDSTRLLAYGLDSQVRVWNLKSGKLETTLEFGRNLLNSVRFTPDGGHVVVAEGVEPYPVRRWNLADGKSTTTYS